MLSVLEKSKLLSQPEKEVQPTETKIDFSEVLFADDVHIMEDRLCKMRLVNMDKQKFADYEELLIQTKKFNEELDGLVLWIKEVETFLAKESIPSDDMDTLDAQLKESTGLLEDFSTLQPTVYSINELGLKLLLRFQTFSLLIVLAFNDFSPHTIQSQTWVKFLV